VAWAAALGLGLLLIPSPFSPDQAVDLTGSPANPLGPTSFAEAGNDLTYAAGASPLLYVSEGANHRIQVFEQAGRYVRQWGSSGNGNRQFAYPSGVAVGADGHVFVADSGNHRVQEFDAAVLVVGPGEDCQGEEEVKHWRHF